MSSLSRKQILDPESGVLLHEILRPTKRDSQILELNRIDFSDPKEFLQGAIIEMPANHSFRAHVHLERERSFSNLRAQESWVVLMGQVEVDYFTDSGDFIVTEILGAGDITISFRGGHGYRTLTSDALVYEFKSGPYEGLEIDKKFI
jgi:hypothetical protein